MAPQTAKRKSSSSSSSAADKNPMSKRSKSRQKTHKTTKNNQPREKVERQAELHEDKALLDLSRPIFPLRHFLDEPGQMVEQLFQIVHQHQIEAMRPHILKDTPICELKLLFEEKLQRMNPITIKCILEGIDLEEDFSNQTLGQDTFSSARVVTIDDLPRTSLRLADSTSQTLEITEPLLITEPERESVGADAAALMKSPGSESAELLELHVDNTDVDSLIADEECKASKEDTKVLQTEETPPTLPTAPVHHQFTRSQISSVEMELLEMELRARAIKTLLKNQSAILPSD